MLKWVKFPPKIRKTPKLRGRVVASGPGHSHKNFFWITQSGFRKVMSNCHILSNLIISSNCVNIWWLRTSDALGYRKSKLSARGAQVNEKSKLSTSGAQVTEKCKILFFDTIS